MKSRSFLCCTFVGFWFPLIPEFWSSRAALIFLVILVPIFWSLVGHALLSSLNDSSHSMSWHCSGGELALMSQCLPAAPSTPVTYHTCSAAFPSVKRRKSQESKQQVFGERSWCCARVVPPPFGLKEAVGLVSPPGASLSLSSPAWSGRHCCLLGSGGCWHPLPQHTRVVKLR